MIKNLINSFVSFQQFFSENITVTNNLSDIVIFKANIQNEVNCKGAHTLLDHCCINSISIEKLLIETAEDNPRMTTVANNFYKQLVVSKKHQCAFPINELQAISCSRHHFEHYKTIREFGENSYRLHINDFKHLTIADYYHHCFIEGLKSGSSNEYSINHWSPALKWLNSGGSHRFSTACYLARREAYTTILTGEITCYRLNHTLLEQMSMNYHCYFLSCDMDSYYLLRSAFEINKKNNADLIELVMPLDGSSSTSQETYEHQNCLLLVNKKNTLPISIIRWLKTGLTSGKLQDFYQIAKEYKKIEEQSIKKIRPYLKSQL